MQICHQSLPPFSQDVPAPIVSKLIGNANSDNNVILALIGDFDADGIEDDMGLIHQRLNGDQYLEIYDGSRIVVNNAIGEPIASDPDIGTTRIILASGID